MKFGTNNVRTETLYLYSASDPNDAEATLMYNLGTEQVTGRNTNPRLVGRSDLKNVPLKTAGAVGNFEVKSLSIDGVEHFYWDKIGVK